MDSAEPQPLIPAPDAPHAYVAVRRMHSVNADRPEWEYPAYVVPEWDRERIDELRHFGFALLPIGPDGDTGTRAVTEPRKITDFGEFTHLPIGTVVAGTDTGTVFERVDCGWMRMGHNIPCYHYEVFEHDKAAVVLRMGSVSDGA
ncbi:hypothetical protein [Nocardia thailandica]|uniref:hypothetical protein n=1 Tax=Nocardia thailandica TaxID=257275 RepID=UPI0005B827ED|nr:hypothetical protein [Nocardia thailandica]